MRIRGKTPVSSFQGKGTFDALPTLGKWVTISSMETFKGFLATKKGQFGVRVLASVLIGLSIFFGFYFGRGMKGKDAADGTAVAGLVLLSFGAFAALANFGFFDLASYGFASVFSSLRKGIVRPYEDAIDYRQRRAGKRAKGRFFFLSYLAVGSVFLIIGLALSFGIDY